MERDQDDNVVELISINATRAASSPAPGRFGHLVGASAPMQEVYRRIDKVAPTQATVLITGGSGSGKEAVAQTIHERSERAGAPFVAINCGAIPGNLIEAELFGYEKGSFTGAARTHRGCFERADVGTLFLDEVTEMPPDMQVRLLRVLETGHYARVGGEQELFAKARIIAAINRDAREAVRDGRLREDLMYRLAVFPIVLPALCERDGDPELLAEHFLQELNDEHDTQKTLSRQAITALRAYHWPGNVRELKNAVHRAFILSDDRVDLEFAELTGGERVGDWLRLAVGTRLAEIERQVIFATLERADGNKRRCAETLGISLKTLYNRLAEYQSVRASVVAQ